MLSLTNVQYAHVKVLVTIGRMVDLSDYKDEIKIAQPVEKVTKQEYSYFRA